MALSLLVVPSVGRPLKSQIHPLESLRQVLLFKENLFVGGYLRPGRPRLIPYAISSVHFGGFDVVISPSAYMPPPKFKSGNRHLRNSSHLPLVLGDVELGSGHSPTSTHRRVDDSIWGNTRRSYDLLGKQVPSRLKGSYNLHAECNCKKQFRSVDVGTPFYNRLARTDREEGTHYKYNNKIINRGIEHLPNFHYLQLAKTPTDLGIGVPYRYTSQPVPEEITDRSSFRLIRKQTSRFFTYKIQIELNLKSIKELIYKKGHLKIENQEVLLTDNNIIEQELGKYGIVCIEYTVHQIYNVGPHFKEVIQMLWPLGLNKLVGGLTGSKTLFKDGGDSGNHEDLIKN
ncbi:hypothetical protein PIB30_003034 [Stylosanthes scabra]|uniref:Uncharacterized protein n=1 Tax=Stylosanthes scabra TaxID=79078 RepID=A0ABU6W3K5_9FABA|nr:hypothetical protein [Stylosanthes scabra]